jgi:hypothetical protein
MDVKSEYHPGRVYLGQGSIVKLYDLVQVDKQPY